MIRKEEMEEEEKEKRPTGCEDRGKIWKRKGKSERIGGSTQKEEEKQCK